MFLLFAKTKRKEIQDWSNYTVAKIYKTFPIVHNFLNTIQYEFLEF